MLTYLVCAMLVRQGGSGPADAPYSTDAAWIYGNSGSTSVVTHHQFTETYFIEDSDTYLRNGETLVVLPSYANTFNSTINSGTLVTGEGVINPTTSRPSSGRTQYIYTIMSSTLEHTDTFYDHFTPVDTAVDAQVRDTDGTTQQMQVTITVPQGGGDPGDPG